MKTNDREMGEQDEEEEEEEEEEYRYRSERAAVALNPTAVVFHIEDSSLEESWNEKDRFEPDKMTTREWTPSQGWDMDSHGLKMSKNVFFQKKKYTIIRIVYFFSNENAFFDIFWP